LSRRATSILIILVAAVGLLRGATAQAPAATGMGVAGAPGSMGNRPQNQTETAAAQSDITNKAAFGQARPSVGPDPTPRIRNANQCPLGYMSPRDAMTMAHLLVCVVKPVDLVMLNNVNGPSPGTPGTVSSMPPILERATSVNQCTGRPVGSYACGRSGSECCRPTQDNMCFAGAFACYPHGTGTGPKTACCISK
jgi:hypothetical protein